MLVIIMVEKGNEDNIDPGAGDKPDEKNEQERAEEFDDKTVRGKVEMLETSTDIKEGLELTEKLLQELKTDLKGGWHIIDNLLKRVPIDQRAKIIHNLALDVIGTHENKRIEKEQYGEVWKHPISVMVKTSYYQCASCHDDLDDEIVVVVERMRSGDKIHVFCCNECLAKYAIRHWAVE